MTTRRHKRQTSPDHSPPFVNSAVTCPKCSATLQRAAQTPRYGAIVIYCPNCKYLLRRPHPPQPPIAPQEPPTCQ